MAARHYMGIDIGTYESKGVLIDAECNVVAEAVVQHGLENPQPGYFEHDAEAVWWADTCALSRQLLQTAGLKGEDVACICPSGLGCDCLAVDEKCHPLHKAILYGIDARAAQEIKWMNEYYGERVASLFPHPLCSSDIAPKILWIKNNRPEVYARAAKFLTASSFLSARLCGAYTIDKYLAGAFAPLYDMDNNRVNEAECAPYCRPDQLAEIRHATDIAGTVTPVAAGQTGLSTATRVLVGTGDSGAESISSGVLRPGDVMVQLGSTCFFIYYAQRMVKDPRIWPGHFIVPGSYCITAGTNTAGILTRWFRDELYPGFLAEEQQGGENAYAKMAREAAAVPAGSNGLLTLPYFAGERTPLNDPDAKGVVFGLRLEHTKAHLYKSALEGIGHSIVQHFQILEENGLPVNRVMLTGGGTKNPVWVQLIADMLDRPVCIPRVRIGASFGDAMMAALADGAVADWHALAAALQIELEVQPDAKNSAVYREMQPLFDELYRRNKDLMHKL